MSDRELRNLLREVIEDIDAGRVRVQRLPRLRQRLLRLMGPPLLAASLGLTGCTDTSVGTQPDGGPADAQVSDAEVGDAAPFVDAAYMAPFDAAPPDAGPEPPYMAPFDAGPEPDYAAPFDAGADQDGGAIPLYMGPPPTP